MRGVPARRYSRSASLLLSARCRRRTTGFFFGNVGVRGASTTIPDCFFCRASKSWLRASGPGHLLVVPFRHVADFFDATDAEQAALLALVREAKTLLDGRFHPDGYNIGVNVRAAAGQTVMHLHVHVIPRYAGDVEDPPGRGPGGSPGEAGVLEGISPASAHHQIYRFSLPSIIYQVKRL